MGISETKMKIVIDNYFKSECNVDTSIRQAFEKGFRIGVQKVITLQPERKKGKWINHQNDGYVDCPFCGALTTCSDGIEDLHFCFSCGAELEGEQE